MLCAKYDYDLDIQVKQEEAFANGMKQGSRNQELGRRNQELGRMAELVDFTRNIVEFCSFLNIKAILLLRNILFQE